MRCNWRLY